MPGDAVAPLVALLTRGGPAMWAIAALSVLTLAVILWKSWHLWRLGAWAPGAAEPIVAAWCAGREPPDPRGGVVAGRGGVVAGLAAAAVASCRTQGLSDAAAREHVTRLARAHLAEARRGLRALDLIAAIAPLLGLLGTVLGMIAAFQALQDSGARTDAAALAGGIWEALLTTAAGMAVAIPAVAALSWFEGLVERLQLAMEDAATRIFTRPAAAPRAVAVA